PGSPQKSHQRSAISYQEQKSRNGASHMGTVCMSMGDRREVLDCPFGAALVQGNSALLKSRKISKVGDGERPVDFMSIPRFRESRCLSPKRSVGGSSGPTLSFSASGAFSRM